MSKYANGLYLTMSTHGKYPCADIYLEWYITTGYGTGSRTPKWYLPLTDLKDYPTNWDDNISKYFNSPTLIAPINLIKWED